MQNFINLLSTLDASKVIEPNIGYNDYVALDLSISNNDLSNHKLESASDYEVFIENYLSLNNAKIAFGGYLETRNLYKRSSVFNNNNSEERNIHIGLDLWINKQASIHAVLDGTIHSFQNNTGLGDYGPAIILEHEIGQFKFYTLYGHLSENSLVDKKVGEQIKKGTQIATLGLPPINGDYAPHLHFQIIIDMEGKTGDYPGVCSKNNLNFYQKNCPNPNTLLKFK
ncbi:MAG: peptidoglycan DD-metalloendopeptidase family protein [Flavobacterium sp.]|uniref:peptidoglycan DD-metalloendopeptidase family protein n=1 Tax=Flavobacterium sp. TaxID=239 RepID=UPI0022C6CAD8|nr:peptidoglycan DD-metalloendopeptidase family protein [Flavobacterium sp.]MCZ8198258.1 peptidoglycan DD-metalloendopeptidase family protein [Flavobacterium sp.]